MWNIYSLKKNQLILHDHRCWGPSPGLQSLCLNHALEKWELEGRGAADLVLCWEAPKIFTCICSPGTLNTVCGLRESISSQKWVVKKEDWNSSPLFNSSTQWSWIQKKDHGCKCPNTTCVLRIYLSPARFWKRVTFISDDSCSLTLVFLGISNKKIWWISKVFSLSKCLFLENIKRKKV